MGGNPLGKEIVPLGQENLLFIRHSDDNNGSGTSLALLLQQRSYAPFFDGCSFNGGLSTCIS